MIWSRGEERGKKERKEEREMRRGKRRERKEANIFEGLSLVNLFPSSDEKIYSEI